MTRNTKLKLTEKEINTITYLSKLNKQFNDLDATLTAYSHGPTVTRSYSKNYIKTNFYVKRVQKNM